MDSIGKTIAMEVIMDSIINRYNNLKERESELTPIDKAMLDDLQDIMDKIRAQEEKRRKQQEDELKTEDEEFKLRCDIVD